MKAKVWIAAAVLAALVSVGCSQIGARSDAQIAGDVQSKINADAAVATKQITIQAANGVVTLSGQVASDAERNAAATDAAQVRGVKTVINNLQVETATAAAPAEPAPADVAPATPAVYQEPAPAVTRRAARREAPALRRRQPAADYSDDTTTRVASAPAPAAPVPAYASASAPAAPAAPARVSIPDGTMLSIRLIDSIDTERNHDGDVFRASLDSPVTVDDQIVIPAGADVQGQIVTSKQQGHYAGQTALALELTQVSYNGHNYPIQTSQYARQSTSRSKGTAAKVGTGAAVGAILGGIFGGGKGAAIGAASGAGVGGAAQTISKPEVIQLPSETVLNFRLSSPVTVTPASTRNRRGSNEP